MSKGRMNNRYGRMRASFAPGDAASGGLLRRDVKTRCEGGFAPGADPPTGARGPGSKQTPPRCRRGETQAKVSESYLIHLP